MGKVVYESKFSSQKQEAIARVLERISVVPNLEEQLRGPLFTLLSEHNKLSRFIKYNDEDIKRAEKRIMESLERNQSMLEKLEEYEKAIFNISTIEEITDFIKIIDSQYEKLLREN